MNRAAGVLLLIIAAEVLVGGYFVVHRLRSPVPPRADWSLFDPATAGQIQAAAASCQSAEDWRNLAELYMAAGCFAEAESCHRVACELDPNNALLARQWGFALERLALLDEANAQYRRAIGLGIRQSDDCRYFIARNHLRTENSVEARRELTAGRALAANEYELARLARREGALAEAADSLRSVAKDRPNALQAHLLGYRLALERGDAQEALAFADRARYAPEKLLNPFDEEAERIVRITQSLGNNLLWKQASELINAGQLDEAEGMLGAAGQTDRSAAVVELLAESAMRRGQHEAAIRLFEEFQEQHGPAARIIARMGDVWEAAGQGAKARAAWLRAAQLEAGVDLKATHHKLAESFSKAGDSRAAAHHLARGHYYVGRDLLQHGYPDKSVDYFVAATRHDPAMSQGWFYLGESRRLTDQGQVAGDAYRECLRLHPNHGRALAGLAMLEWGGSGTER